jgi:signal transduction histidine kinase
MLDVDIEDPYRALVSATRLGRIRDRIMDPATWKDLAYLLLLMPLGLVSFTVAVGLGGTALVLLTLAAWAWAVPEGVDIGFFTVDTVWEGVLTIPLAVVVWALFLLAVRGLVSLHGAVARALLTASPDPVMAARLAQLQDSRARIIAAADAERRRLERDLHDGAQQRLVSLSMQLGLAKRRLAKGEDVRELVASADAELHAAIKELRDLARGIHPAVLTDRGLAPALRDVATRAPLPVELGELPAERLPGPVEAAAYFTVSEALTNVARYAGATVAHVDVRTRDGRLAIEVADDGVGGADAATGSGLSGLADRLGALGGELRVASPAGEGTRLSATIPLDQPEAALDLTAPAPAATGELRRRVLQSHAVVYALVMALLVFIWLTTGGGYFWPQWAIAGWGSVLALHAWFARGRPAGMLARPTDAS